MSKSSYITSSVATNCHLNIKLHNITSSDQLSSKHQAAQHHFQPPTPVLTSSYILSTVVTNNHLNIKLSNITKIDKLLSQHQAT
jgi:hypothetical protein